MGTLRLALVALIALGACGKREAESGKGVADVVLRGGWIVDGSGNPRYQGDVAVAGDRIAAVGVLGAAQARETVDVSGLVVAPGFIDMMGQSEINVLIDNRVLSKITQGITTEVTGEGGSVAALTDQLVLDDSDAMKKWHYREDWRDLDGYFAQLGKQGAALNIATFVGATQVRLAVVGKANRAPTAAELARMTALVDTLMEQGALGLWTALEYAPASYSKTDELIALAKAARRHGGIYASHMRNEGVRIDDALNELFQIAREADIPAEVSHLKVSGRRRWGQMPRIIARIDSARAAGLDVTADQYPYTRAATALDASIPSWAESGGWDSLLGRRRRRADHGDVPGLVALPAGQDRRRDRRPAAPRPRGDAVRYRARRERASHRRRVCCDERARRPDRHEDVVGGGEHRLRWRGAGRAVRDAVRPPTHLRHLRAHPRPLRARPEAVPARVRGPQDDRPRGAARRALGSRFAQNGD